MMDDDDDDDDEDDDDLPLYFMCSVHKRYARGAQPIGAPGCPELAASGWSALTARIVLTHFSSNADPWYLGDIRFLVLLCDTQSWRRVSGRFQRIQTKKCLKNNEG